MKAKQTLIAGVVLSVLAAMAQSALAEETVATESVKVTASRVEQELQDVNMSVSVITAQDIEQSEARTIGELLKDVPGVRINNDGSQGMKRIQIRGEDTFRTLVLIDGQKISEHKSMSGSPMLIDPSAVERIEVIKGPTSVLYGSDAIGGVVNIITKKGGQKAFQADVSVGGDTSSYGRQAAASISGNVDGWHYRLGAAYEKGEDLRTPAGKMKGTDFESKSVNAFLAYDVDKNTQVGLTLDYFDHEFNSISVETPGFYVHVPEWKRTKAGVFYEQKNVSDYLSRVRVDAFYQKNEKSMTNFVPGATTGAPMDISPMADNTIDQYGISAQADWQLGDNHTLITGYEFEYDELDSTSTTQFKMLMAQYGGQDYRYKRVIPYNGTWQSHAIFAAMESTFGDFVLNYGARYTYVKSDIDSAKANRVEIDAHGRYTAGQVTRLPSWDVAAKSNHDDKVVFNFGVLYKGIEDVTLRASWAQGFRAPILQERYVPTAMGSTGVTYGNPDLKPETSNNFEIGARYLKGGLSLDAAAFLSLADDYIATLPYGSSAYSSNYRYENVAEAKSYGIELSGSYAIAGTGFEPYANITWLRRQYDNGNGYKTYDTGTPEFWARYGVRYHTDWNGFLFRSDVYAVSQTASKYKSSSGASDYRLGGATTLNIAAGVSFGPQKQYRIDGGVYNIFDKKYQNATSLYEPGRYAAIKFNASF